MAVLEYILLVGAIVAAVGSIACFFVGITMEIPPPDQTPPAKKMRLF